MVIEIWRCDNDEQWDLREVRVVQLEDSLQDLVQRLMEKATQKYIKSEAEALSEFLRIGEGYWVGDGDYYVCPRNELEQQLLAHERQRASA